MLSDTSYRDISRQSRANSKPIPYYKRDVTDRICDFDEYILGFDDELAIAEAERCLQCPEPQACTLSCPAGNDIPQALWHISQGEFIEAAQVFSATSPLPEICGRVCPSLCQQGCVLSRRHGPASIGKLEWFVADYAREAGALTINVPEAKTGKRVAVVGSGPAGITVAEDMAKLGHEVTVYEAWPEAGGVLVYGIPNFKLEKEVVGYKIHDLEEAGVRFVTNTRIGEDISLDELQAQYDAVFLGTGAGVEAKMNIPGEDLAGIYTSTDYLVRANVPQEKLPLEKQEKPQIGRRVAVIGGGDTAVDCARSSIRLGAEEVSIVYRRTEAEMPGNKTERGTCVEEGAKINYLQAPVEYIGDENGRLKAMKVIKMELGAPDKSGRRRPVPIEGSEFIQEVDTVVLAVGYWPDPLLSEKSPDLQTHKWGLILADEKVGATSRKGVFAAGDNVHGPDLVITAVAGAHKAAASMQQYLSGDWAAWPQA
ncbi:MAG: NAD(P)-dependent oxidoreductase [Ardenticatenaceae bacterium]|nr:NAD(P)-dependent oxidoreductase [Anaerolineales bacterium]MCB8920559.1 NAD(P)-dependent oxidoreductase [Ardenticatenaceae bacterium]MCB8990182.1 NAD(P)-dependent oxidoreductase [Ardenticatenaceae bacterium]MCB9003027.1 NAD(P)-dependent oxidoreductase [Ardenticatenaceae bacterium]